jgi:hypothetical protein
VFWLTYLNWTTPWGSMMRMVGTIWSTFEPLHPGDTVDKALALMGRQDISSFRELALDSF